jgi:hypothetical protein
MLYNENTSHLVEVCDTILIIGSRACMDDEQH